MPVLCVTEEQCFKDANHHGQLEYLVRVTQGIESKQNIAELETLGSSPYLKCGLGRSYRLIAKKQEVDDYTVITFLRIVAKSSKDYRNILSATCSGQVNLLEKICPKSDDDYRNEIRRRFETGTVPQPLPAPSDEEIGWLYAGHTVDSTSRAGGYELMILESRSWMESISAPAIEPRQALYHQLLHETKLVDLEARDDFGVSILLSIEKVAGDEVDQRPEAPSGAVEGSEIEFVALAIPRMTTGLQAQLWGFVYQEPEAVGGLVEEIARAALEQSCPRGGEGREGRAHL